MQFDIRSGDIAKAKTPCLILGVFDKGRLSPSAAAVDKASGGALTALLGKGDLGDQAGSTLVAYDLPQIAAERVLLLGLGKRKAFTRGAYIKVLDAALKRLADMRVSDALCAIADLPRDIDPYHGARIALLRAAQAGYRYEHTKKPAREAAPALQRLDLWLAHKKDADAFALAAAHGRAIGAGVTLARELSDLPGNICTPTHLAERALELAERYDTLSTEILEEEDMRRLGMGALLSVSSGSRQPAKLIVMRHRGAGARKDAKPVVLVGKGLTFDAGGISIKPAEAMDEMKYDMAGGASVFGALLAACEMQLPLDVIGVVPASENLPGGAANKPGDIVTSLSGQTIEILNTDAEGRLILCDALTYVERFDPALVVDIATLTGACIVALGRHPSGLFTNDDDLAAEITAAGEDAADRVWRLPLWDDYQKQLDCNFADMANVGGRDGGAITAAAFLSRYTKAYPWAHLDIAGTAWLTGKEKGATGRPVPLLSELLIRRSGAAD
ncbi:leucyl aminopeptidase [Thiohalocapsa marina]|uniref:Probable cytosol aminopeptidase n=1 Tax=Thiohalocapsa marina TaxID=424902 RepID=A0A5M8FMB1_9GAMM|nr:leucyl aminopeptidase [Thiohalocapsa marina]KAA6185634.1 leucyl aminopeptidase [Thiohalocapsa marina]